MKHGTYNPHFIDSVWMLIEAGLDLLNEWSRPVSVCHHRMSQ